MNTDVHINKKLLVYRRMKSSLKAFMQNISCDLIVINIFFKKILFYLFLSEIIQYFFSHLKFIRKLKFLNSPTLPTKRKSN